MKALVLGGGAIKGAWEAGVISAVLERGFQPDLVVGISVGSINAAFLVNNYESDWKASSDKLLQFWKHHILTPENILKKNSVFKLLFQILRKKYNGLYSTKPIDKIIDQTISIQKLRESSVQLFVGTVSLTGGNIIYADPSYTNFKQYIKGSKAFPIIMPPVKIGSNLFCDGGLIDSAPLGKAISEGATEIIAIGTHPKKNSTSSENMHDLNKLLERIIDIVGWNTLNNDIKSVIDTNQRLKTNPEIGKKHIHLTVIRPRNAIMTSITDFNSKDIETMINSGYYEAMKILG